jgi:hypothetical protein
MSTSSKLQRIKEIIMAASKEGEKDTAEAIDSGNYNMYPYEAASGRGLMAVVEAVDVASAPDEDDLKSMRKTMYGDENSDKPVFLPTMTGSLSSNIRGTRLAKELSLKEGMDEDEVVRRALEKYGAYGGTSKPHGLIIQDRLNTANPDKIAEQLLGNQKGIDSYQIVRDPRKFKVLEKESGLEPGTSLGFFDPNKPRNPLMSRQDAYNQGDSSRVIAINADPSLGFEDIASTIRHEQGHANELSAYGREKLLDTVGTTSATPEKLKSIAGIAGKDFARSAFEKNKSSKKYKSLLTSRPKHIERRLFTDSSGALFALRRLFNDPSGFAFGVSVHNDIASTKYNAKMPRCTRQIS